MSESVGMRISYFLQEQAALGRKPSLTEIMNECHCSRNTAIRYRREQLGDKAGVAETAQ